MAIRTTTYLCHSDKCGRCHSTRSGRGVGEYRKHKDGSETLINCSDCYRTLKCGNCGKVYPLSESEKLSPSRINGVAKACISCMPSRHQREISKAADRIRLKLARHIACQRARKKRIIYRDVAVRYLRLFGGHIFSVQTDVDAPEAYLENAKGMILGKVSTLDQYPKGLDDVIVDEIPF